MAKKKDSFYDEEETHPTFGMVSLHKTSIGGDGMALFGSSVLHSRAVALEVHTAVRTRLLHHEKAFSRRLLARLYLSPVQLSELLMSVNTTGVPCTLKYYRGPDGKLVDAGDTPETAKAQKTYEEFGSQVKKASRKIREMQARLRALAEAGKPLGKKALQQLVIDMGVAAQEVDSNMPFIVTRFAEACQGTVRDAKGEIEAFISAKVEATGINALASITPTLPLLEHDAGEDK